MNNKVIICGIPYTIKEVNVIDDVSSGKILGRIEYGKQEIQVRSDLPKEAKEETIIHEMVHGILEHIGEDELTVNEKFVQQLANAIYNSSFDLNIRDI